MYHFDFTKLPKILTIKVQTILEILHIKKDINSVSNERDIQQLSQIYTNLTDIK